MKAKRNVVALAVLLFGGAAWGQHAAGSSTASSAETRTARAFEAAKKMGTPELYAFLKLMPKGADVHMHLSGAIYAETFIREAERQGLCVTAPPPPCEYDPRDKEKDPAKSCPLPVLNLKAPSAPLSFAQPGADGACARGQMPVSEAVQSQPVYDALIDSFSMRSFVPSAGWSAHDQFFATFDRFSGLKNMQGEWLDEVATRAAAQNEQYLEIMNTPSFNHVFSAMEKVQWPAGLDDANHLQFFAHLREQLLANGLREDVVIDSKELADAQAKRHNHEYCPNGDFDRPRLTDAEASHHAGCSVRIHYLYQVLRGFPPLQVFAQTLLGFELASADPDVVGINFVRAEDWRGPMANYHTEMLMLDYLHSVYPKVRISLHAGELAPGMVTPEGLSFHIREAVELGHAERIGHGVDVLHEDRSSELLKEMAAKHVAVEINLTSNDVILGIKGTEHPLAAYRAAHVPVALSTDDEGVSRIDLTHEYVKGALEQGLTYADLKKMARTSLEHSFLPGESLWAMPDDFTRRKRACSASISATSSPSGACATLLHTSERAAQEWELERRFAAFEAGTH